MRSLFFKVTVILGITVTASVKAQNQIPKSNTESKAIELLAQNPDLTNDDAAKALDALKKKKPGITNYLRDLNIKFKTFQADKLGSGLGFTYQYDNSWKKYQTSEKHIYSHGINLDFDGNVAFKKAFNPVDFMQSKIGYNGTFIWGGTAKRNSVEEMEALKKADQLLFIANDAKNAALRSKALDDGAKSMSLSNQYFVGLTANAAFESNQDFSKTQFVPGLVFNLGIKPWKKDGSLRWFNLPDYPFALLRLLTGTADHFEISRASFPSVLAGLDCVVPGQDSLRKAATGKLDPYYRMRLEAAFKTKAAVVLDQVIWFSADYRWYHELDAPQAVKNAKLAKYDYFSSSLSASNGFFVSYSYGKLPFDKRKDAVYSLGFKYDLGNFNK